MATAEWIKELRKLGGLAPSEQDIESLMREILNDESHRGAALIAGGILESTLTAFLKARLGLLTSSTEEKLFGRDCPLETFADQIVIAYGFKLIDADIFADLNRFREIRNAFAHARVPVTFASAAIATACGGFRANSAGFSDLPWEEGDPRRSYFGTMARLLNALSRGRAMNATMPVSYAKEKSIGLAPSYDK